MESAIVIKVKYEDTLRRFNARIVNEELDLNMDGLREKILSLFCFAPNTELKLTYLDEDSDVVALVDDDDLRDVVRQALNPLRITVSLNASSTKSAKPSARSSGSSTPSLPRHGLQNLNSNVSEALKSLPEPLREPLAKLSSDLASRAATYAAPNLAEITESLSKLGSYYINQLPHVAELNKASEVFESSDVSKKAGASADVPLKESGGKAALKTNNVLPKSSVMNDELNPEGVSKATGLEALLPSAGSNNTAIKQSVPVGNSLHSTDSKPQVAVGNSKEVKRSSVCDPNGKTADVSYSGAPPGVFKIKPSGINLNASPCSRRWWGPSGSHNTEGSWLRKQPVPVSDYSSGPLSSASPLNECPFTGMPLGNDSAIPPNFPSDVSFRRSYNYSDGVFHRGVRCDGCGVHPITGPRFKSKVKEDYDLCSICFAEMGNETDYLRIDRPVIYRHPLSFKGLYDQHGRARPPTLPQVFRGHGAKATRPKLDSRFIQDVNVLDGTVMPPFTCFTKIWRMRNNGTIVWPQGTRLVWIGGDVLTSTPSVELEISMPGLPVDKELDVAVDFVAPELPGRYISYWRMASPTGQKFGQRVWVLIQVDASVKESIQEVAHGLNLNLPPATENVTAREVDIAHPESTMEDRLPEPNMCNVYIETVEPVVNAQLNKEQEAKFPINDSLLVGGDTSNASAQLSSVSYPIVDLTAEVQPVESTTTLAPEVVQTPNEENNEHIIMEKKLLNELEEMGFKQVDLNKEILRMNQYDLEQSVDDLCGVSEWDPILEELQEMGFADKETNKKLLKKNNGSIKRVVMDLIAGETE